MLLAVLYFPVSGGQPGDYFVCVDLADGYYAPGNCEEDRDCFTVKYRGKL
jgi:hypothetical protein